MLPGGVKRIEFTRFGQNRHVSDSPDILHRNGLACFTEEQVVNDESQRRSFASQGDIGGAEVADDRNPRSESDDLRVADLKRTSDFKRMGDSGKG